MNRKKRPFLFLSLAVIFFITAPLAVFYSQGYRFDLQNLRLIQTGAFYFMITPRNAEITVIPEGNTDILIRRNTSFFFGTAYIENLIPRKYNITVSKDGYHSWQKSLEIEEKKITKIKNIVLLPRDLEFSLVNDKVLDIFPLPHQNKMAIKEVYNEEDWRILIHNPTTGTTELLISSEDLVLPKNEPINIFSFPRTERLILSAGLTHIILNPEDGSHFVIENINSPVFHPRENKTIIHLDNGSLVAFNYENEISSVLADNVESFGIRQDESLFWLSSEGFLFKDGEIIQDSFFSLSEENQYEIYFPNQWTTSIRKNNYFYFLENDFGFRQKFHSFHNPVTSPDMRKLANFNDHEIRILFLEEETEQPQKKYGDNVFLTRFSGKIGKINWLTSHYLIFNVDNQIKAMEIDDRDNINIFDLAEFTNPKIHFDLLSKQLYILSDKNLFISKKLLP